MLPRYLIVGALLLGFATGNAQQPKLPPTPPPTPSNGAPPSLDDIVNGRLPAPPAQTYTVTLAGEEITLHIVSPRPSNRAMKIDDNAAGGFFDRLAAAARDEKDDYAAHALYRSLRFCKPFPKSQAEFDATIKEGRKNWAQTGGRPGGAGDTEAQDFDQWTKHQERFFRRCNGVTDDMDATATQLLRESVERGADINRAFYARAIQKTDPEGAREQYQILWDKGDINGLGGLGSMGSLPHGIAATLVVGALFEKPDKGAGSLQRIQAAVSPSTYEQASKEAAQMLKNPKCCVFSTDSN